MPYTILQRKGRCWITIFGTMGQIIEFLTDFVKRYNLMSEDNNRVVSNFLLSF